jgi:hypothetical protein
MIRLEFCVFVAPVFSGAVVASLFKDVRLLWAFFEFVVPSAVTAVLLSASTVVGGISKVATLEAMDH